MADLRELNIGKEALSGTIAQFGTVIFGFVGTIAFARILGPTSFGGVVFFLAVVGFIGQPMDGFGVAVHKYVSESTEIVDEAFGAQLLFNLGWIAVLSIPILLLGGPFAERTQIGRASILAILYLVTNSVVETLYAPLQGLGRIGLSYWIDTAKRLFGVGFRIVGVVVFGAVGMIYGSIAIAGLFLPIVAWYIGTRPSVPSLSLLHRHGGYAKFSIPSSLLSSFAKRIDVFLLGALVSAAAVSWYEIAWQLALPAFYLAQTIGTGLMTKVSAIGNQKDKLRNEINTVLSYTSILAIPVFFGSGALGEQVITLVFGNEYTAATPFLIGLTGYQLVRSQNFPLEEVIHGLNHPDIVFSIRLVISVTNAVLGIVLLLTLGPIGIVYATIFAGIIRYGLLLRVFRRRFDILVRPQYQFGEQLVAGFVMFVAIGTGTRILSSISQVETVLLVIFGSVIYFFTLAIIGPSHRELLFHLYSQYRPS